MPDAAPHGGERPQPAATPDDLVRAGSRWVGEFKFEGPDGPTGPVVLTVTGRSGEQVVGRYETEHKFEWETRGTIAADGKIRLSLGKPLNPETEATNAKAELVGKCSGPEMSLAFLDSHDGSVAKMTLALEK
jgi:hypothetical protein